MITPNGQDELNQETPEHFFSFSAFLKLVFTRCAENVIIQAFLAEGKNSKRVKDAAHTLSHLHHRAIAGDEDAMGELILLTTQATCYLTQASQVQVPLAQKCAQLTPAWPLMVFPQAGLNQNNFQLLAALKVGNRLQISNKTLQGLTDRSGGLAALLKVFVEVRRAFIKLRKEKSGQNGQPPQTPSVKSNIKTDLNEAKQVVDELTPKKLGESDSLAFWWESQNMKREKYFKMVWQWFRRNRVKKTS